ncbi:hypothetical protein Pla22_49970 [Rubripirellula amarantea]|uniref:Uncharacterized protein n=1 Tax=Rubripirellula amarantea TaxID=2527999 RepID=A0A5C5WBW8_9BACT|nr:hypothetical protein [Rubripirellula amarantea]TWT47997.1 hypothetical protein Pla22_49970 [Rubripirellula amarantea]
MIWNRVDRGSVLDVAKHGTAELAFGSAISRQRLKTEHIVASQARVKSDNGSDMRAAANESTIARTATTAAPYHRIVRRLQVKKG